MMGRWGGRVLRLRRREWLLRWGLLLLLLSWRGLLLGWWGLPRRGSRGEGGGVLLWWWGMPLIPLRQEHRC